MSAPTGQSRKLRLMVVDDSAYNRRNIARAWTRVVRAFVESG